LAIVRNVKMLFKLATKEIHRERAVQEIETDYLIIGAGAVGLSFADTLLEQTDATITIVDRHGKPGGHWNDAYSFVALHQPSAFYGVDSMPLGENRKDDMGVNKGLYELASGPEVSGYFERVMRQRLLASGRVSYYPMCDYRGQGKFVSLLSGQETVVKVKKKTVDGTFFNTTVPSTHTPKFKVGEGVRFAPLNVLPNLWMKPESLPDHFVIVGAGKTAMDAIVWLLGSGAAADKISWIVPRDSWLLNRIKTQPGLEFFEETLGGQADQMEAFATATDVDDLFLRLEACGVMLRIDRAVKPTMFHYATMSKGEIDQLARIKNVIRHGRVTEIDAAGIVCEHGQTAFPANTLYVDCTASAVPPRATVPVFQGDLITPQMTRIPQPAFSAALAAYVEANYETDEQKNALCGAIPLPNLLTDFPKAALGNMMNQYAWGQDKKLGAWIQNCRLDGFGKVIAQLTPEDTDRIAILKKLRGFSMAAAGNLTKLIAATS
jgi:NAD(P)-binding Rossmann-like domain